MESSRIQGDQDPQGHSPLHEENASDRNINPEDEAVIKQVIGQALKEFGPTIISEVDNIVTSKVNQVVTDKLKEFEQQHPILTNLPPNMGLLATQGSTESFDFKKFSSCKPPEFEGELNPVISLRWLSRMEETFLLSKCPENLKVLFAAHQLKGGAHEWWNSKIETYGFETASQFSWDTFKDMFKSEFSPPAEMEKLKGEFLAIDQGKMSVAEYSKSFHEKSRYCPEYTSNKKLLTDHFYRHLNLEIRESIDPVFYDDIPKILNRALVKEKDLLAKRAEYESKRKAEQSTSSQSSSFKKTGFDTKSSSQQPSQNSQQQ